MRIITAVAILALSSSAYAQCHLADPQRATSLDAEERLVNNVSRSGKYVCHYAARPSNGKTYIACEVTPGTCEQEFQGEMKLSSEPWCFLQQVANVPNEETLRQQIALKMQEQRKAGPYSCTVRPFSKNNPTPYYQCESEAGLCKRTIASYEAESALTQGFFSMRDAAAANGEGYYRESFTGRQYWCDNAYGCQPR